MIPASHLLTGYLAGRAIRLKLEGSAPKRAWLDPVVIMAVGASVLPDLDVVPGLFSFSASDWHRGLTHSFIGIAVQAIVATVGARAAWKLVFGETLARKPLLAAAFAGLVTHVAWDFLNPWGVGLFQPFGEEEYGANLVHEGDLFVLSSLVAGALLVAGRRYRIGFGVPVLFIVGYAMFQWQWSVAIGRQAEAEPSSHLVRAYPNAQLDCLWLVLTRFPDRTEARCAAQMLSGGHRLLLEKARIDDARVTATNAIVEVQNYKNQRHFPFAEVHERPDGSATVIWRDLREAIFEIDAEEVSGYYVYFSAAGRVVGHEHNWFLRLWFW
jgi:membrane-bound metal-dependent hydrolase YbcI (DUF457 family)